MGRLPTLESMFGDDATILRETDFQLLLLVNFLPAAGTALLSPILDSLTGPFGVSPATAGLMISFFTAPPVVMIPVAGALADHYGRKSILVSSLALFSMAGTAIAFTTDFRVALGLRMLQGVAYAGLTPIIVTSIGDIYVGTKEATAQGLRFTNTGFSQMTIPLLGGFLVAFAWQYPFLLHLAALPVALLVYLYFEEPSTYEGTIDATGDGVTSYRHALYRLVWRRRVVALVLARATGPVVWIGFITYNSFIVVHLVGGTPGEAGLLVAIGSVALAGSASQAGRISSLFKNRLYPLVAANCCLTVGFTIFVFAPRIPVAAVGISVVGVGFGVVISLYRSIITGLASDELRAGLVSVSEAGSRMVITLTPIAMGAIITAASPVFGFVSAVRLAGLCTAVVGGMGGIVALLVAHWSAPAPAERKAPADD